MKITIDIKTDNAAFQDNPEETWNVLDEAISIIGTGERSGNLRDSNGNKVGEFKVTGK